MISEMANILLYDLPTYDILLNEKYTEIIAAMDRFFF